MQPPTSVAHSMTNKSTMPGAVPHSQFSLATGLRCNRLPHLAGWHGAEQQQQQRLKQRPASWAHGTSSGSGRVLSQLSAVAGAGVTGSVPDALPYNWRPDTPPAADPTVKNTRYNTRRIKLCSDWRQLARVVEVHGDNFNALNSCAALVHLAQLGDPPQQPLPGLSAGAAALDNYAAYEALLQRLLQMVCASIPELQGRQVANVMWAAASLSQGYTGGHPMCVNLMRQLVEPSTALLPWSNAQELSNSIWAVATVQLPVDDIWLLQFLNSVETALPTTSCQDLATVLWGLAELGVAPDSEWVGAYLGRLRELVTSASHRDAAQILAAMARLGLDLPTLDNQLLAALRVQLLAERQREQQGSAGALQEEERWSHSISQGLWAMAQMSAVPPTAWMQQALRRMQAQLSEFKPQEIATSLWAAVTLGQAVPSALVTAVYLTTLANATMQHSSAAAAALPSEPHTHTPVPAQPGDSPATAVEEQGGSRAVLSGFCPQSLAELIWAVASASHAHAQRSGVSARTLTPPTEWTAAFLNTVESQLSQGFTEQPTAMVLVSLARLGITPPPTWAAAVLTHISTHLRNMSPRALSNCLWALATLGFQVNADGLVAVEQQLECSLQQESAAMDTQAAVEPALFAGADELESCSSGHSAHQWGSQELSNVLWVLAKWRYRPCDHVVQLLLGRVRLLCVQQADVRPQELANTLWSLSQLGVQPSEAWLSDVWVACVQRMRMFNHKDIAQMVHALAKLGRCPPHLTQQQLIAPPAARPDWAAGNLLTDSQLQPPPASRQAAAPAAAELDWTKVVLTEAAATLGKCSGQDLANLSWGLAQLGVQPGQAWCARLAHELMTRGSAFSGSHLATCVWALGSMGYKPAPQSLMPLEGKLFRRLPALAPRELAACCWGFSSMSYQPDPEWLEAFASQCRLMAAEFTQQDWSVVVYSLSGIVESDKTADIYLEDLFLSPQLLACLDKFGPSGVAILLYAASVLGAKSPRLMGRLLAAATPHMAHFSGRELTALITSCARADVRPDREFFSAWATEVSRRMQHALEMPHAAPQQKPQGFGGAASTTQPASAQPTSSASAHTMQPAAAHVSDPAAPAATSTPQGADSEAHAWTPTMVAVSSWALAKLKVRPKADWQQLFMTLIARHAQHNTFTAKEAHMVVLALAAWECKVSPQLLNKLHIMIKHYRPTYTRAERYSVNLAFKILKEGPRAAQAKPAAAHC